VNVFHDRLAMVTGAGDGIGAMLARGLAGWGMRVCVQDIRAEAAQAVAQEIGGSAFPLVFDVSDRDACEAAAQDLKVQGEPLSFLWINAGVGVGASLLTGKPNVIEWAFGVNALGMIWTAQTFVPLMTDMVGPRHVGFTASSASLRPPGGDLPLYPATKHASFAIADGLGAELAKRDIASTLLCPGLFNTQIWDGARARPERFGGIRRMDPSIAERWNKAKSPALMWPEIERTVLGGGGYIVCATEDSTLSDVDAYADAIRTSIVQI
jgi:NAD(P)-dependent dehydrogenase (short-subunit alcohol dehydrogenase family)